MMVTATVYKNASLDSVTPAEWDAAMTKEAFKGYLKGNCLKYLWRMDYKGKDLEDLEKSLWYLERLKSVMLKER